MTKQLLDKMNLEIRLHFGDTPAGCPAYKWCKSTDLFYFYEKPGYKEGLSPGGIWVAQKEWERHSYADMYGNKWLLAMWTPPECGPSEWSLIMQDAFPYPSNGEYHPIESTVLDVGVEPNENLNRYTLMKLYKHLGMEWNEHLDTANTTLEKVAKDDQTMTDDMIDDVVPAFGNVPGERMHVSFPSVK